MEIVKDKHPHCPQCGRKRGVTLRKISITILSSFFKASPEINIQYFICCKNCRRRWKE